MKQIWMAQQGDYEQRIVCLVGNSPKAVAEGLKLQHEKYRRDNPHQCHCNGYDVEWGPLRAKDPKYSPNEFEIVAKYIGSEAVYDISQIEYFE